MPCIKSAQSQASQNSREFKGHKHGRNIWFPEVIRKKEKNMCVLRRRSAQMIDPPLGSMLANGKGHSFKNSWSNIMCSGESFREVWQSVSHSHTTKSKTCTYMPGDLTGRQALLEKKQGRLHHFNWYLEGFFGVADKTVSVVCITHLT